MKILKFFKYNTVPILFSILLTCGFAILNFINESTYSEYYFIGSAILYTLLIFELGSMRIWGNMRLKQLNIPILDQYSHVNQFVLHSILPTLTFWGFVFFIFFGPNPTIWVFTLVFICLVFMFLFINLRAYYLDKFKLEQQTHHIYDVLKLIIFGIISFDLISLGFVYEVSSFAIALLIFFTAGFIFLLNLMRYNQISTVLYAFGAAKSFLIALISFLMLEYSNFDQLELSFLIFLLFYISVGILHHKIKRDLSLRLVLEYLVVAILAFSVFYLI